MEIDKMKVQNYMTSNPITVQQDISISDAINIMASKGIGNLIVMEGSSGPVGLLTERELVDYLSLNGRIPNLPLKDVLVYQSFNDISPDTSILDAANTMISMKTRLLVFDGDNKLVGIITASDMVRAFSKSGKDSSLERAMNKKIIDVQFSDSILGAIKLMSSKSIGSVIVNDKNSSNKTKEPYGIFTERDLLNKILLKSIDLETKVGPHCSTPLITAPIYIHSTEAAKLMATNNIKRLPLTDEGKPTAMITARDLVEVFSTYNKRDLKLDMEEGVYD